MTTNSTEHPMLPGGSAPSVDELFGGSAPLQSAEDLARDGVFDDGEVEEFLADLYEMRRTDLA